MGGQQTHGAVGIVSFSTVEIASCLRPVDLEESAVSYRMDQRRPAQLGVSMSWVQDVAAGNRVAPVGGPCEAVAVAELSTSPISPSPPA